jgi:hypothetical protein
MADRSAGASPTISAGGAVAVAAPAGRPVRAGWLAPVVLFDYVAAFGSFAGAGGYLILKVLNDNYSLLYPVIEETARWFFYLDLHRMPGLPDYPSLRTFVIPDFAFVYLIAMAGLHLLAAAGFLALARGLSRLRPRARRAHIGIAGLSILILGGYAYLYARSTAPPIGLAVMAGAAIVPAAVLAILLAPGIASLFATDPRPDGAIAPRPELRRTRLPRLLLGVFLAAYVLGALATVWVISVPVAIVLKAVYAPSD